MNLKKYLNLKKGLCPRDPSGGPRKAFALEKPETTSYIKDNCTDRDIWVEKQKITSKINTFAWRDQGRWKELLTLFDEQATISVSWYSGEIDGFVDASTHMASTGKFRTKHLIGLPRISISGEKALTETDTIIMIRSSFGPLEVDITSSVRFFDRLLRNTSGDWKILSRVAIYEKDRIDPVSPSVLFWLFNRLARFDKYPHEFKHLAYGLERKGWKLAPKVYTSGSYEERQLKTEALIWLEGNSKASLP